MTRHKHADLMIALAENSELEIERKTFNGSWGDSLSPNFDMLAEYRIKPKNVTFEIELYPYHNNEFVTFTTDSGNPNCKVTFSSDGDLLSVELIKS